MLAAWFRITYPQIIDGALAGSAPILDFSNLPSIPPYYTTVTNDFRKVNSQCPEIARAAFSELLTLSKTREGLEQLTSIFKVCSPLTANDIEHLILWAENSFGTLAMVDYPEPADFIAPLPAWPVNVACGYLLKNNGNSTQKLMGLAEAAGLFYNGTTGKLRCFDIYTEFVFCADQTGCGTGPSSKAWDYLACTEMIFRPQTNNVTDMFPPRSWTEQDLETYCMKTWRVTPRPDWIKTIFGGENIKQASNIIFSNGLLDPWHGGGFLSSLSDSLIAVILVDGAHHLDLRYPSSEDPPSVTQAREKEQQIISSWVAKKQTSQSF